MGRAPFSAGKLHAAFDVAGTGNVAGPRCCDTSQPKGRGNREHKHRPKPARQSPTLLSGGTMERSSRQGHSLAGCKSPYRQFPVFRRLAYPVRAEVTKHDVPGRRSPGCPAAVLAAVGTIWGASKLGGRNITKYLQ